MFGARERKKIEAGRVELQCHVRLAAVRVRADDRGDELPERAEDPVGVEAGDGIDGAPELGVELHGHLGGRTGAGRIEPVVEPGDELAHRVGVRGQRVGEVRIGEPQPGLAQVLAECTDDDDLPRREPGAQHEPVQAVVLDRARPHAEEDVGDASLHLGIAERITSGGPHAERVDPPRLAVGSRDLVRALVDHRHVEVLEQRHHVGQHRARRPRGRA